MAEQADTPVSWAPTTDQVAALMLSRTRTRGQGGRVSGTFGEDTYPSDEQAQTAITDAVDATLLELRKTHDGDDRVLARGLTRAATYWAAAELLISAPETRFPEAEYDRMIARFRDLVKAAAGRIDVLEGGDGDTGSVGASSGGPAVFAFPTGPLAGSMAW